MRRRFARPLVLAAVLLVSAAGLSAARQAEAVEGRVALREPSDRVVVSRIKRYARITWRWQRLIGVRPTRTYGRVRRDHSHAYRIWVLRLWQRRALHARRKATRPPRLRAWLCIHRYEGAWTDSGDPYWGGLQMDRAFMRAYAPGWLLRKGWANRWTPFEQIWVAERAYRRGRRLYPWPNTSQACGLL